MDYYVCSVEHFGVDHHHTKLEVHLPDQIKPLTIPRKSWPQHFSLNKGLVWCSGGGSYVLGSRYIPLIQRDHQAPSNPGKLTIASGLTDEEQELINPSMLIRELFEEIVIVKDGSLLIPDLELASLSPRDIIESSCSSLTHLNHLPKRPISATLIDKAQQEHIRVHYRGATSHTHCHLCLHEHTVNVLFYINLGDLLDISSLQFYDTETVIKNNGDNIRVPLNRPIFFYDLKEDVVIDAQKKICNLDKTYHAQAAIDRLKNIFGERHD